MIWLFLWLNLTSFSCNLERMQLNSISWRSVLVPLHFSTCTHVYVTLSLTYSPKILTKHQNQYRSCDNNVTAFHSCDNLIWKTHLYVALYLRKLYEFCYCVPIYHYYHCKDNYHKMVKSQSYILQPITMFYVLKQPLRDFRYDKMTKWNHYHVL